MTPSKHEIDTVLTPLLLVTPPKKKLIYLKRGGEVRWGYIQTDHKPKIDLTQDHELDAIEGEPGIT